MRSEDLILVTGATGNTGSTLLQELETRHARVRAMVREQPDGGRLRGTSATVVAGNFNDPRSLEAALEGVTRAYLVTPSSPDAEAQQIRFAELAAAAGVRHLVKLSQFAADEASPVRFLRYHAAVERRIRELGVGFSFLRPNLYFQGLLAFQSMIAKDGRFVAPVGDARVSADVPPQAFAGALSAAGVPPWQVDGLTEDYAHYARGEAEAISPHVREVTGADPRDVRTFAKDYARVFGSE